MKTYAVADFTYPRPAVAVAPFFYKRKKMMVSIQFLSYLQYYSTESE